MMKLHQLEGERCERCGTPFDSPRTRKRFCSEACATRTRYERSQERLRVAREAANRGCCCPECGRTFDAAHSIQKYCSYRCGRRVAKRAYRAKLKARRARQPIPCPHCAKPFTPRNKFQIYCSGDCLYAARRRLRRLHIASPVRTCRICGTTFEAWHLKLSCSPACHREADRRRGLAHYYASKARQRDALSMPGALLQASL